VFPEPFAQSDIKLWPFKVIAEQGSKCSLVVSAQGEDKKYHPVDVSAMIIVIMKETAKASS